MLITMSAQRELGPEPGQSLKEGVPFVKRDLSEYKACVETDPLMIGRVWFNIAWRYKRSFAPDRPIIQVLREIVYDKYSERDRSKIVVMKKPDTPDTPEKPGSFEDFVGTMRLVSGKRGVETGFDGTLDGPIEAWDLIMPPNFWEIYLIENKLAKEEIGELGRLSFAEDCSLSQYVEIAKCLLEQSLYVASEDGMKRVFAVMPSAIALIFKDGGHEPTQIPGSKLLNNKKVHKLQIDYPGYWANENPRRQPQLYYWDVPQDPAPQKL
jgi:hypothetical protein